MRYAKGNLVTSFLAWVHPTTICVSTYTHKITLSYLSCTRLNHTNSWWSPLPEEIHQVFCSMLLVRGSTHRVLFLDTLFSTSLSNKNFGYSMKTSPSKSPLRNVDFTPIWYTCIPSSHAKARMILNDWYLITGIMANELFLPCTCIIPKIPILTLY